MKYFFELLKVAAGNSDKLSHPLTEEQWMKMFEEAKRQTLTGIFLDALGLLKEEYRPSRRVIGRGYMAMQKVEMKNKAINADCNKVCRFFHHKGYYSTVLKGQGVSRYYPNPLHRVSGDIDIWIMPKDGETMSVGRRVENIIRLVQSVSKTMKASYHHIESPRIVESEVEIHYRPSYMFTPWHNSRLQKYFGSRAAEEMKNFVTVDDIRFVAATDEFNVVFLLSHIYRHLFEEGIGLRQIMDYYWMLVSSKIATDNAKRVMLEKQLRSLGLQNIASALMWVLEEVFGMDKRYMITEPNERIGRFLLAEIMATGNFGQYDERTSESMRKSPMGHNIIRLKRDVALMRFFPSECFFEPFFRVYHWIWRTFRMWRF